MVKQKKQWIAMQLAALLLATGAFLVLRPHLAKAIGVNPSGSIAGMSGQGTMNSPYQVSTCENLQDLDQDPDGFFVLANDIDCSSSVGWNSGAGFLPIGMATPFSGTLDGHGHTINSLYINQNSNSNDNINTGLFAKGVESLHLLNFSVTNATIIGNTSTNNSTATTAGIIALTETQDNSPMISRVHFDGDINLPDCTNGHAIGGIIGVTTAKLRFDRSSSTGDITVNDDSACGDHGSAAGGLIGQAYTEEDSAIIITNSHSNMNISFNGQADPNAQPAMGGLVGYAWGIDIFKSYASGTLTTTDSQLTYTVGGLVGGYGFSLNLSGNFAATTMDFPVGSGNVGGLIGNDNGGSGTGAWQDNYFDIQATGLGLTADCVGNSFPNNETRCTGVNGNGSQPNYFKNNHTNQPIAGWDFTNTWQTTAGYPELITNNDPNPEAPTGVITQAHSKDRIGVAWDSASDPDIRYHIFSRKTDTTDWQDSDAGAVNVYNFSGLDQNSEYEFQVVAIGPDGYISQPSNTVNASTWADVSNGMEGNGSTGNPYQVTTCQELQDITMHLQSGVQYILANDIDCSDSITWNNGTGFEPIGMHGEPFNGTLSGNGHAITNLYIDQTANVFNNEIVTGLFGVAGGSARLLNFKLANATIIGAQTTGETTGSTGGIIGKIDSSSGGSPVVSRVSFDGSITLPGCNGYHYVGGIVGRMTGDLNLDSTSSTGDIVVNDNGDCYEYNYAVGGLAGAIEGTDIDNTTVSNSYSTMNITVSGEATSYCGILCRDIGGLIGLANNVSVQKSYAAGDIDVIGDTGSFAQYIIAGGLIGEQNSNISLIDNFAATPIDVPVQATWVGAMVGFDHNYAISGGSWSNDLFDYTVLGLGTDAPCVGSTPGATRCSGVNSNGSQNNYFTNNHANEPMASWNFNTLWETTSGYPRHRTDANITAAAPTGVTTSIASTTAITISWDATSDPSDTYNLNYRKTGASSWTSHAAGTVANSISVSGLDEATSYDFQVIRFDKFGYHSDAVIVTASTARPNYTLISSCQDLQNMNNNLTENYELAHDIDCSDTVNWDGGQGFKPVGTFEPFTGNVNPFSGVLAGNTHTISNLYCNRPGEATCGLFSMTTDAVIQDLTLQSPVIDDAILSAGSLVGVVLNSTITNVHSKDVTINGNPAIAGGLIGAAATGGNPQTDFVTITKSSVTGSITTPAGGTANIGGFIGGISASVNIQDNYSNVAITTAAVSMGGGFTGMAQIQDSSIISRNYAAGSFMVTSSDPELNQASPLLQGFPTTYSLLGGFGGVYVDDDDDSATATITNNFDHVALSSVSPENMSTGFFVAATNPDVDFSTNAFDADQAGTTNCASSQVGLINCNAISGQPNYFKNNSSNSPLNEWDFVNIWKKTTEFPVFDEVVLTTPTTNVVPPVVSSAQQPCFTAIFGFGECPKPTVKPVAPTVEQAVATAVKTESIVGATTRGSATTPADEVGVLGAIKNFVRSLPLVVVVGFPYLLFGLLFLAIIVLLLELLREMRRAHLLEALIKKQQLLAEERDAFWHLAANYLRAPVTLIAGGAEALRDMHAIDQTSSISILATSLQTKVGDIMKKIEGSVSLQSISKIPHGLKRGHVRRSVYLVPLAIIGLLVVLANYAASSYRNINPGTMGYLAQALIFVCVAVGLYWALSYLIQGKKRRKLAQDMYERQTTELASARHDLINDTATILASDTNKLDMLIKNLPATIASTAPGALATLREGTDRLREIVHSFEMLIKVQEADTVATSTVDLGTILSKARAKLTPQITSKNVRVMAPAAALSVSAESEMAQQVIDSIVSNAVDYSPTGGTVNVETRNLGDHVQVRITDQGQGISKDQLAHLFQPFVRADGKSAMDMSHGGFGINLYLDKLIMEKLGGTIEAASAPGKGTAITLTWPS